MRNSARPFEEGKDAMKNVENKLLNKTQYAWARRLQDLMADVPPGIQLVIRPGRADVVHAGIKERGLDKCDPGKQAGFIDRESRVVIGLSTYVLPISDYLAADVDVRSLSEIGTDKGNA